MEINTQTSIEISISLLFCLFVDIKNVSVKKILDDYF